MSKLRVYELAKEMNKTNKEMLGLLKEKGIEVASHMSTLSEEQIKEVMEVAEQMSEEVLQELEKSFCNTI